MKVKLAQAGAPGQGGQVRLLRMALIKKANDPGDAFVVIHKPAGAMQFSCAQFNFERAPNPPDSCGDLFSDWPLRGN
jgi:hypothetical protein